MYGAGLTQPGNMKGIVLEAAEIVIIEMGYNDNGTSEPTEAVKRMRMMSWLECLSRSREMVKRVIFVQQPSYKRVAGASNRRRKVTPWGGAAGGALVRGSMWNHEAMVLLKKELSIQSELLDVPGQDLFDGFSMFDNSALWVDDCKNSRFTLWVDAEHPSFNRVKIHLRRLLDLLRHTFDLGIV